MGVINRLKLLFAYGPELEQILKDMRSKMAIQEQEIEKHHLSLCLKHQQEANHSRFSESNCDYCRLLKGIRRKVDYLNQGDRP